MTKVVHALITNNYTEIHHERKEEMKYGAPHRFTVFPVNGDTAVAKIHFQEGPIKEVGVNGIANEDALAMVLCRLQAFQEGPYKCKENEMAIVKLEETLMWLRARTNSRVNRGVEGTSNL